MEHASVVMIKRSWLVNSRIAGVFSRCRFPFGSAPRTNVPLRDRGEVEAKLPGIAKVERKRKATQSQAGFVAVVGNVST